MNGPISEQAFASRTSKCAERDRSRSGNHSRLVSGKSVEIELLSVCETLRPRLT